MLTFARVSKPNFKTSSCFLPAACFLLFCVKWTLFEWLIVCSTCSEDGCLRFRARMQMIRSHSNFLSKRPHCVPGTLLSSLCVLYHLILTTALLVRTVEVFTDEESEADLPSVTVIGGVRTQALLGACFRWPIVPSQSRPGQQLLSFFLLQYGPGHP